MMVKLVLLICILNSFGSVFNTDICDRKSSEEDIDENILAKNKIPQEGNAYSIANATSFYKCVEQCCSSLTCNLAFFQQSKTCYLIQCSSNELCEPVKSLRKSPEEDDDYIVKVRSFALKQRTDAEGIDSPKVNECNPKESNSCPFNEFCQLNDATRSYECYCKSENHLRIKNRCYEYLKNSQTCKIHSNDCSDPHEICLTPNSYSKQGTCQCNYSFERDGNGKCISQIMTSDNLPPQSEIDNQINQLLNTFNTENSNLPPQKQEPNVNTAQQKTQAVTASSATTTIIKSTLSINNNTQTTFSSNTDERAKSRDQMVNTNKNAIANAGESQNVYLPTTVCILNGTNSRALNNNRIVRWQWSKSELSPSIGDFAIISGESTSSNTIAIIENLVEGEYTFILKVWTDNSNYEYSQSTVQVFVRSNNANTKNNYSEILDNRLKLDLNINPLKFFEIEKANLLNKLQLILQQPPIITSPKIRVLNHEILKLHQKSGISIEFYVIDEFQNNKVVDGGLAIRLLYKLLKSNKLLQINTILNIHATAEDSKNTASNLNFYEEVLVRDLRQMRCLNNCSSHGYCDMITYKCVCDQFWVFNLYRYYALNNDETYGNNCEWNYLLAILGIIVAIVGSILLLYLCLKCICCCCCCCCTSKRNKRRYDLNDHDDMMDSNKKRKNKESCFKRLFCCLCRCCRRKDEFDDSNRKKTNEVKYALLENKDDSFQFSVRGKKAKEERIYGLNSSDEEYENRVMTTKNQKSGPRNRVVNNNVDDDDEEEDILYDQNMSNDSTRQTQSKVIKKSSKSIV